MDRQIVYPGAIPLDTDILNFERSAMVAVGYLAQAVFGTNTIVDGLACMTTQPASLTVQIGPGSITQLGTVDTTSFGSLPADTSDPLLRMGVNITSTPFTMTAPSGSGQAVDFLIQAAFLEDDATPVVLPYYNAADPSMPYTGPNNSGAAQNTQRLQRVQLEMKSGAPAASGTQVPPNVDAGWAGLYIITVASGQTAITAANISTLPAAPFLPWKLPALSPGTSHLAKFTPSNQGNWIAPAGVSRVRLRVWGGGGAGGAGIGGAGGGGAGGGYSEGFYAVTPGATYLVAVGSGGVGAGTAGGTSSFGSLVTATGGGAGANGSSGNGGAGASAGGAGTGTGFVMTGQSGANAFQAGTNWVSGRGGASFGGDGGQSVLAPGAGSADGSPGMTPGGGGAGGSGNGLGGVGGAGLVIIEW